MAERIMADNEAARDAVDLILALIDGDDAAVGRFDGSSVVLRETARQAAVLAAMVASDHGVTTRQIVEALREIYEPEDGESS